MDRVEDVAVARREHADGIGLFRSELLLNGDGLPGLTGPDSERAQADIYRRAILAMAPRPVTIRTFDLDEGQATSGRASVDAGPELDRHRVLGLRGVRLGMSQPALLDTQLRAILRAATTGGTVRILVPFVTAPFEMEHVAARLELARQALTAEGLQVPAVALGAMIEVPAAALAADHLAEVSDFLAVGTNDLVQYLLAADRTDQRLAALVSGVHPALLRLLRLLPRLAARHAVPVSVCGELASQPTMLALLIGLGVREFSMTPTALGTARRVVESSDLAVLTRHGTPGRAHGPAGGTRTSRRTRPGAAGHTVRAGGQTLGDHPCQRFRASTNRGATSCTGRRPTATSARSSTSTRATRSAFSTTTRRTRRSCCCRASSCSRSRSTASW